MEIKCPNCGWKSSLTPEQLTAAMGAAAQKQAEYHLEHCPQCQWVIRVPVAGIQVALPNPKPVKKPAAKKPAAKKLKPTVKKATAKKAPAKKPAVKKKPAAKKKPAQKPKPAVKKPPAKKPVAKKTKKPAVKKKVD